MTGTTLQRLLDEGVEKEVFPSAQAVVLRAGRILFEGLAGEADPETPFDLASVTKVIATTTLVMDLWSRGTLTPEMPLNRFEAESPVALAGATVADLLYHRAGLPGFIPLFERPLRASPELVTYGGSPERRRRVAREVMEQAWRTPLLYPRGSKALYSDLGFILLGELICRVSGVPLDSLFEERIAAPLGLRCSFHRLSCLPADARTAAPTGFSRPREPAPGQEGLWAPFEPVPSGRGEVDDDNAFALDGVAGHAGLFGTATAVARYGQAVLEELKGAGRWAPPELWAHALRCDGKTPGSSRAMGFDTPTLPSSAGEIFGNRPPGAVGHLGFTGTSLWIDLGRELVVALCTNRTARGRADGRIREFRPRFHDQVMQTLSL